MFKHLLRLYDVVLILEEGNDEAIHNQVFHVTLLEEEVTQVVVGIEEKSSVYWVLSSGHLLKEDAEIRHEQLLLERNVAV